VHQYKKNATGTESRIDGKETNKKLELPAAVDWGFS
jgi:hypothetical protein